MPTDHPPIHYESSTRRRLLDHGVLYLTDHGYHGSGLKGVLADIGVPKGSFYHYFASKDAFCAAVIEHYIQPFIARLEDLVNDDRVPSEAILPLYFSGLIEGAAKRNFTGGCLLGNLMGELGGQEHLASVRALKRAMECYTAALAAAIVPGQIEGVYRRDLEAGMMADLLVNQWQGALLRAKLFRSRDPLHACFDRLVMQYFREK